MSATTRGPAMSSITEWDAREARMEALGVTHDDWPCDTYDWAERDHDTDTRCPEPPRARITYCTPVSHTDWLTDLERDQRTTS